MAILRIEPNVVDDGGSFTFGNVIATANVSAAAYYWANGTPFASSSYGNTDVAAYLLTSNVTTGNVSAVGYYWANGTPFASSSYGNTDVAAYLPIHTGNISANNLTATGNIVGGGVRTTTSATAPALPTVGDIWYNTNDDTIYRYTNNGVEDFWLDVTGPVTITSNIDIAAELISYRIWSNANAASQSLSIDAINANVTAQTSNINTINSNILAVNVAISGLQSNAAFQANLLDVLTGNASTQGSLLDVLVANAAAQSLSLTNLLSNAAAQESSLTTLVSNAAIQSGAIDAINANVGAYQTYANANAASQSTSINAINANIGAYQTYANANAASQSTSIDTINANIGAYQTWSNANAAGQTTSINTLNANVGAYETWANSAINSKAPTASPTFTGTTTVSGLLNVGDTATFTGTSANSAAKITNVKEPVYIIASAPASTQTIDVSSGAVQYFTSNATVNWIFNIRFSSGTAANSAMSVGDSITVAVLTSQGSTAYYPTAVQVDGTATGVSTRWQSGTVPSSGNTNGLDVYTFSVIKTAATPTFTILASQTKFA